MLQYFLIVFNKTIISLALVVNDEIIIANPELRDSLAIYHLISNAHSWNSGIIVKYYIWTNFASDK